MFRVGPSQLPAPLSARHTHGIAQRPEIRLVHDSVDLGWRGLYASLVQESPWADELPVSVATGLAFCLAHASPVQRRLGRAKASAVLRPGQFSVLPAQVPTWWQIGGTPRVLHLYLSPQVFRDVAEAQARPVASIALQPQLCVHDPVIAHLAHTALAMLIERDAANACVADQIAYALAARLLSHHAVRPTSAKPQAPASVAQQRWRTLVDYIDAHLEDRLSLAVLAAQVGVQPTQIWRLFKAHFGISPHHYILTRRLALAQELLRQPDANLADIAARAGFSSQSHLTSTFRKHLGLTPGHYRRHHQ